VKFLLDTHVMLWWLRDDPKLGPRSRADIAESGAHLMVSIASFWEFSIKFRKGKFEELGSTLVAEAASQGLEVLAITPPHLRALESLPHVEGHNDPFDHLILAQALAEDATLVTSDRLMRGYDIKIWQDR
jgi:PIN domain nuclease of toxin-antitoxin system